MIRFTGAFVAMGALLSGCTAIEGPSTNSEMVMATDGREVECRRIKEMGTMLGRRVCMEPAEWAQIDEQAEEEGRRFIDEVSADGGLMPMDP
ncbi:hypothetical protein D1224_04450 [Henriciella barbarensis]|uniref:Uncharacterized protein n=1 Tax=Henriciella barbarensis TaxID=86342 RepID=A0A399QX65_9PROT|nr:hypothetical protein [Henriciella barbarensis]RIJ23518.1 hypothetical protein D1224_04450 [Henriciella barbarensis]